MTHLKLSVAEVTAVRRVLMIDDALVYDARIRSLLGIMHRLVPSDSLGFGIGDRFGYLKYDVVLPDRAYADLGPHVCDGPLHTGLEHLVGSPECQAELVWLGIRDCVRVGFPLGGGRVAQVWFDRSHSCFEPRHIALLSMLQPALARLVRPPDTTVPAEALANLSAAERQVLDLVSLGATNHEVADQLSVSEATVRKHLEHSYRKLGVTNRTAASALVRVGVPA